MKKARIVIADDHPIVLTGLRVMIAAERDFELVGEATSGLDALRMITAAKPDIAIVDISLPQMNGIVLARRLAEECPAVGVIVLTGHDDRVYLHQALEAGVRGFILKRSAATYLVHAIRGVLVGGLYLDPTVAGAALEESSGKGRRGMGIAPLTEREKEVLKLTALGFTGKQIAFKLDLSAKSVETYKRRGLGKISGKTRADIVRYASAQGWLEDV